MSQAIQESDDDAGCVNPHVQCTARGENTDKLIINSDSQQAPVCHNRTETTSWYWNSHRSTVVDKAVSALFKNSFLSLRPENVTFTYEKWENGRRVFELNLIWLHRSETVPLYKSADSMIIHEINWLQVCFHIFIVANSYLAYAFMHMVIAYPKYGSSRKTWMTTGNK